MKHLTFRDVHSTLKSMQMYRILMMWCLVQTQEEKFMKGNIIFLKHTRILVYIDDYIYSFKNVFIT